MSLLRATVYLKSGKEIQFEKKPNQKLFVDQQGHFVSVGIRDESNGYREVGIFPMKSIDYVLKFPE